jgi:hypothetical protein
MFPPNTTTYPVTKPILVEDACIIVAAFFLSIANFKIWEAVTKKRNQKQIDRQQEAEEKDKQETDIAKELMLRTDAAKKAWERHFGNSTETSIPRSGKSSEKKVSTEVVELGEYPGYMTRSTTYASSTAILGEPSQEQIVFPYTPVTVIARDTDAVQEAPDISEPAPLPPPATPLPVPLLTPQPRGSQSRTSLSAVSSLRNSGDQFFSAESNADEHPVSPVIGAEDTRSSTVDPTFDELSERSISGPLSSFSEDQAVPEASIGEALRGVPEADPVTGDVAGVVSPIAHSTSTSPMFPTERSPTESSIEKGLTSIPEVSEDARSSIVELNPKRLTRESLAERGSQDLSFVKKHHMFEWTKRASEAEEPLNMDIDWPQVPGRPASPPTTVEANLSSPLITGEAKKPAEKVSVEAAVSQATKGVRWESSDRESMNKSKELSRNESSSAPPSITSSGASTSSFKGIDPRRLHSGIGSRRESLTSLAEESDGEEEDRKPPAARTGVQKTVGGMDYSTTLLGQREHKITSRRAALSIINTEGAGQSMTHVTDLRSQTASPIAEEDSDDEIPLSKRREILLARQSSSSSTPPRPPMRTVSNSSQLYQPRPEPRRQASGAGRPGLVERASEFDLSRQQARLSQTMEQRGSLSQSPVPLGQRASQQSLLGNASRQSLLYGREQRASQQNLLQNFDSHQPSRDRSQRQSQQAQLYAQWHRQSFQQQQQQQQRQQESSGVIESEMDQRRQQMIREKRERDFQAGQHSLVRDQMDYYRQSAMRTASGALHHNVAIARLQQQANRTSGEPKRTSSGNHMNPGP